MKAGNDSIFIWCKVAQLICWVTALLCVLYFAALAMTTGSFLRQGFRYVWLAGSIVFFLEGVFFRRQLSYFKTSGMFSLSRKQRFGQFLFVVVIFSGCGVSVGELSFILKQPERIPADIPVKYVLVLGGGTRADGSVGKTTVERLQVAAAYLRAHSESVAVVTEGKSFFSPEPGATGMKRYLVAEGISADRILCENSAMNTEENFLYSAEVIAKAEFFSASEARQLPVLVVTSCSHMQRSLYLARRQGYSHVYGLSAPVPGLNILDVYLREIASMVKLQLMETVRLLWG